MQYKDINLLKENINPFEDIGKGWCLITAGNEQGFNTMTASWGFFGVMWGKNVATIVIRPQRRTVDFLRKSDNFTISFFDEEHRDILKYCGSHSGRDVDKIKETGLTPFSIDGTISFEQAKRVFVCKKLYEQKIDPECFIDKNLLSNYPINDYHIAFVGEIVKAVKIEK